MQTFDTLNANLLDSDLLNVKSKNHNLYYSANGDAEGEVEYENEESIEDEGEESQVSGGVPFQDLIRFRQLVREKKAQLKAQYGKAYIDNRSTTERECKTVQVPKTRMVDKEVCINVPYTRWDANINCTKVFGKEVCAGGFIGGTNRECRNVPTPQVYTEAEEVCVNVPKLRLVWVSGWRKQWREFKRNGGLEQLKLQAKGLAPTITPIFQPNLVDEQIDNKIEDDGITNEDELSETETETNEIEDSDEIKPKTKPKRKPKTKKPTSVSAKKISSDKIAGIPNEVIIGLAVAFVLVGGYLIINKK